MKSKERFLYITDYTAGVIDKCSGSSASAVRCLEEKFVSCLDRRLCSR